jgi:hypothetical protein
VGFFETPEQLRALQGFLDFKMLHGDASFQEVMPLFKR